jgi:hypothetical protein
MQKSLFRKSHRFAPADTGVGRDKDALDALESMEDEDEDIASFNEVEEHIEQDDYDLNGDDASDEMFVDAAIGESLIDDVDAYLDDDNDTDS